MNSIYPYVILLSQYKEVYVRLNEVVQEIGLLILTQSKRNLTNRHNIKIDDHNLEKVERSTETTLLYP